MLYRITAVEARPEFRIWVRFEDGVEGEVDLSDIAGRGVFRRWIERPNEFAQVQPDSESGAPIWPGELDIAPDVIYEKLTPGPGVESRRVG